MEILGYENYIIFENGKCLSKSREKTHNTNTVSKEMYLKPRKRKEYYTYALYRDGKQKSFSIHRLVAEAFLPNPNHYRVVNHKDGNTANNHKDNLEWCSYIYNGQSTNKPNSAKGTIMTYKGKRNTTYNGKIRIYGKYHYTKSYKTKEEVQNEIDEIIKKMDNINI